MKDVKVVFANDGTIIIGEVINDPGRVLNGVAVLRPVSISIVPVMDKDERGSNKLKLSMGPYPAVAAGMITEKDENQTVNVHNVVYIGVPTAEILAEYEKGVQMLYSNIIVPPSISSQMLNNNLVNFPGK